jgi:hypothetical protein
MYSYIREEEQRFSPLSIWSSKTYSIFLSEDQDLTRATINQGLVIELLPRRDRFMTLGLYPSSIKLDQL